MKRERERSAETSREHTRKSVQPWWTPLIGSMIACRKQPADTPMKAQATSGMFTRGPESIATGHLKITAIRASGGKPFAPTIEEYDGLIPPEGLPDEERQNWHDVLQSFSKETCQMAQYYRRWPGVGKKLQGFFLHLRKLVEITCTQEFPPATNCRQRSGGRSDHYAKALAHRHRRHRLRTTRAIRAPAMPRGGDDRILLGLRLHGLRRFVHD